MPPHPHQGPHTPHGGGPRCPGSLLAGVVLGAGQRGVLGDVGDDLRELAVGRRPGVLISSLNYPQAINNPGNPLINYPY